MDPETPEIKKRTLFDCFSPNCGTNLAAAVAEVLAEGLLPVQINVLGNFVTAVGTNLTYIAAQKEINELLCPKKKTVTVEAQDGESGAEQGTSAQSGDTQRDELTAVT
jgi:hypothetical protein